MTLPTWSGGCFDLADMLAVLHRAIFTLFYPLGLISSRPILSSLSACEGRRSPLFQYDTGSRPNFTCRTFTALSVLLQYQPLLTRGTTFLCDRRVRTLSCAMERVPKSRCAMRSARTYRRPHFCKAFRPLLSVYSIRGFEREPLLQRF